MTKLRGKTRAAPAGAWTGWLPFARPLGEVWAKGHRSGILRMDLVLRAR